MDWELKSTLEARETAARQREIDAAVAGRVAAMASGVEVVSDETLLSERAVKFGQVLRGVVSLTTSHRPWAHRKAKRLVEPFTDVYSRAIPENEYRVVSKRFFGLEVETVPRVRTLSTAWRGWRTQPVNDAHDGNYQFGWQVGRVDEIIKKSSSSRFRTLGNRLGTPTPDGNTIRIWRTATRFEDGSVADEESQMAYELDARAGRVTSYTEGKPDDHLATLGKDANLHVLSLLGKAIDFLDA